MGLESYTLPDFLIPNIDLEILLGDENTVVTAESQITRKTDDLSVPLVLDYHEGLNLHEICINKRKLEAHEYYFSDNKSKLIIPNVPEDKFSITTITSVNPKTNTSCQGMYLSAGKIITTQCESNSCRKIFPTIDRLDVLAKYTVRVIGDKDKYPVLLSNGNLPKEGEYGDIEGTNDHYAFWNDPLLKSGNIFAVVGGDLRFIEDFYYTKSGRKITVRAYTRPGLEERARYALEVAKKTLEWHEEKYGYEYELDQYTILALPDFNAGAMENRGLVIYNEKNMLLDPRYACDSDYARVITTVAHEYMHDLRGNLIGLLRSNELPLKEGFATHEEGEFSHNILGRDVYIIDEAQNLREKQYPEDFGPLAHPVRPEGDINLNNLYDATTYSKGARIFEMLKVILGDEKFLAAKKLYFERMREKPACFEDLIAAMQEKSEIDLSQFMNWLTQAGTPRVEVEKFYDEARKKYILRLSQSGAEKPFMIPIKMGFVGSDFNKTLLLTEKVQEFEFDDIEPNAIPSLLRDFSAPVILDAKKLYSLDDLINLAQNDSNAFTRWDAAQQVYMHFFVKGLDQDAEKLTSMYMHILHDDNIDSGLKEKLLSLPTINNIVQQINGKYDPTEINNRILMVKKLISNSCFTMLECGHNKLNQEVDIDDEFTAEIAGKRALRNLLTELLSFCDEITPSEINNIISRQTQANNFDNIYNALLIAMHTPEKMPNALNLLAELVTENNWLEDDTMRNNILALHANYRGTGIFKLLESTVKNRSLFDIRIPNHIYYLVRNFIQQNPVSFHHDSGAGYEFVTNIILKLDLEVKNSHIAVIIAKSMIPDENLCDVKKSKILDCFRRISEQDISADLREIISKSLNESSGCSESLLADSAKLNHPLFVSAAAAAATTSASHGNWHGLEM